MPTILFLTLKTFSATGGVEKFNRSFAKALVENGQEEGWQTMVLSAYDEQPDEKYVGENHFQGYGRNKRRFTWAALQKARQADVIIGSHINLAAVMQLIKWVFPAKKLVLVAHGVEIWGSLSSIQQKLLQSVNQVWSVSRFTAGKLIAEKGLPAERSRVFHNCLDPFLATDEKTEVDKIRTSYGLSGNEQLILTVSRLAVTEKRKGYDAVIRCMPALRRQFPYIKYLLCGKADKAELERIVQLIDSLQVKESVILAGFIPDGQLQDHYRLADLFVMPSQKEGFGIVFVEAVAAGLAVIAGNQDGSADALLDGKLGTLIDPNSQQQIEDAIVQALKNPLSTKQKAIRRQLVQDHFGFDTFQRRQAFYITELLNEKKK